MAITSFKGANRWLSNFWEADLEFEGVTYSSSEHAYQAAKTKDPDEREWVRSARTCGISKRRGQKVTLRKNWDDIKIDVMHEILIEKFKNEKLKGWLLDTGNEHLVEGNNWSDHFWGVCDGRGENHLGRLLMTVRASLKKECSSA